MKVSQERLMKDILELGKIGSDPNRGITRFTMTKEDIAARKMVMRLMEEAGLSVYLDQALNIIGRRPGVDDTLPPVTTGSHIDTVTNGGRLDGAYGVLAAIEAIRVLRDYSIKTLHPIEVFSFTNEESGRFPGLLGSRVMGGVLSLENALNIKDVDGTTFGDALRKEGFDPYQLRPVKREPKSIAAHIELHIEQGSVLESENIPIGVVQSIVGVTQLKFSIHGRADHAGTTPMNMRRDALLPASEAVLRVNALARRIKKGSVVTVGLLRVLPGSSNIVPEKVEFTVDFRNSSREILNRLSEGVKESVSTACSKYGLTHNIETLVSAEPTAMSPTVVDAVCNAAKTLEIPYKLMNSGAGHDTQIVARLADTGMIFVPSINGRSHCPEEWTKPEDLAKGADVLLYTILQLAKKQ